MASLKIKEILCLLYSVLLFLSGVLIIVFSVILVYKLFSVSYNFKFVPSSTVGPFIVLFLLGIFHLFLTWLGVRGPSREHDFHIILFIAISCVLCIAECAVGVWSVVLWDEVDVETVNLMTQSYQTLSKNDYDKKYWIRLESKMKCCGLNGIQDYQQMKDFKPYACCDASVANSLCPELQVFENGCKTPLTRYVKRLLIDAAIMGFSCGLFQVLGIFIFYTFIKALKQERSERIARRLAMQRSASQQGNGQPSGQPEVNVAPAPPPVAASPHPATPATPPPTS